MERAEASELQLAQAQQQLRALKQTATARAAAGEAGTSAAISAAQVMHSATTCSTSGSDFIRFSAELMAWERSPGVAAAREKSRGYCLLIQGVPI